MKIPYFLNPWLKVKQNLCEVPVGEQRADLEAFYPKLSWNAGEHASIRMKKPPSTGEEKLVFLSVTNTQPQFYI